MDILPSKHTQIIKKKVELFFGLSLTLTDDGITGTTLDRPGFQNMIKAIEAGYISAVIVKDLSRLGRDYLKVGYYTEPLSTRAQSN